jgi:MscS family membrane protein
VRRADEALAQAGVDLRALLPPEWLEPSLFGLQRWQWGALLILAAAIGALTLLFSRLTAALVRRFRKDKASADRVNASIIAPLRLFWASLLGRIAVPALGLSPDAAASWVTVLRIGLELAVFWGAFRAVRAWSEQFPLSHFAQTHPGSRALVSLLASVARVAFFFFAILVALSELGYSVTSVLAGLGIGGIALALGAQKTLEHVFGAFALAIDQPIREGDFIRVEGDLLGTVENIGLRSTRIRTLDRTVVSIPNGKLADMRLETFAARDRIRLATMLTLRYDTRAEQLEKVLAGFRAALEAQPKLYKDTPITVRLAKLGHAGQEIDVMAWMETADWQEFLAIRQQVLMQFLAVLDEAGTTLAFPTQTLQLERAPSK